MAFIPTADCVLAILQFSIGSLEWTNTLWFKQAGFDSTDMQNLADDLLLWINGHVLAYLQHDVDYDGCTVYDMTVEGGGSVEGDPSTFDGAIAGDPAAVNACVVVTFRTPMRGRRYRGRNYISGFSEDDTGDTGVTDAAIITAIEDAYDELASHVTGNGWNHVIVSFQKDGAPLAQGEPTAVTDYEVRNALFGSQRRRVRRP